MFWLTNGTRFHLHIKGVDLIFGVLWSTASYLWGDLIAELSEEPIGEVGEGPRRSGTRRMDDKHNVHVIYIYIDICMYVILFNLFIYSIFISNMIMFNKTIQKWTIKMQKIAEEHRRTTFFSTKSPRLLVSSCFYIFSWNPNGGRFYLNGASWWLIMDRSSLLLIICILGWLGESFESFESFEQWFEGSDLAPHISERLDERNKKHLQAVSMANTGRHHCAHQPEIVGDDSAKLSQGIPANLNVTDASP